MYLLFKSFFLGLKIIDVVKESLILIFKSERFLKNLAGEGLTIIVP